MSSTSKMVEIAEEHDELIIGTERGLVDRLRQRFPEKTLIPLSGAAICGNMKMNTLAKLAWSLDHLQHEIVLDEAVRRARGGGAPAHAGALRRLAGADRGGGGAGAGGGAPAGLRLRLSRPRLDRPPEPGGVVPCANCGPPRSIGAARHDRARREATRADI